MEVYEKYGKNEVEMTVVLLPLIFIFFFFAFYEDHLRISW